MHAETRPAWDRMGANDFERLAEEYGTPFYLYDADAIAARIKMVRDLTGNRAAVYYAVKANPNLELLKAIREVADGLDISSGGELLQANEAGFDMENLSFAGPAKSPAEQRASIEAGVGNISVESMHELETIVGIAGELGKKAHIVLRVNPKFLNRAFGLKMGGRPVQFGIEEDALPDAVAAVSANAVHLDFRGIHIYAGSQCFEGEAVVEGVRDTLRIAREIETESDLECRTVNLGGGFGVSHSQDSTELDFAAIAAELTEVLDEFHASVDFERHVVFELGRYLVADAGIYVSRVINSKVSRDKPFFMLDGGLHHHLSAAGTFGTALRSNFVLRNLTHPDAPETKCNLAGPSCNPTDLLGVGVEIPEPEIGGLIGVLKSGSYGLTASPVLFLGRPTPVELVRRDGEVRLARRSRNILDFN